MFRRTIRRVAFIATLATSLLTTAVPASASATGFVIEGSSTIYIAPDFYDLSEHFTGHSTTNVCAPNSASPMAIPVAFDSTGGGIVGAVTTNWTDLVIGTTNIKRRLVIVSGGFSLSATEMTLTLALRFEYRTCNSLTVLCVTNNVTMTMVGPSVGHHPTASTHVTLTGSSTGHITVPISCNNVIRTVLASEHAVAALNLHFV